MAPSIIQPARPAPSPLGSEPNPPADPKVWIIPAVVGGGVVMTALLVWAVLAIRKRQKAKAAADDFDPYLTGPDLARKRKMSATERVEEEEKQRIIMIRKSLASRSWGTESDTSRRDSRTSSNSHPAGPTIPEDTGEEGPVKLKDDWKAWEAQLQRSATLEQHPAAVDGADKTAKSRTSRSPSPHSRNPLLEQSPGTPPRSPGGLGQT